MIRTVTVTVTCTGVCAERLDVRAWETSSPCPVLRVETEHVPVAQKGTVSLASSCSDTAPFGNVQWQLSPSRHIVPVQVGQLDAANVSGCG